MGLKPVIELPAGGAGLRARIGDFPTGSESPLWHGEGQGPGERGCGRGRSFVSLGDDGPQGTSAAVPGGG